MIAAFAVWHVAKYEGPFEDSFITYRYARNAAGGLGVVYNPGERVEGCTSLAWTLILAAFAKLRFPIPETGTVLSLVSAGALLLLTASLAWRSTDRRGWSFLVAPALLAANGTFAYYAGTGMETLFFSLLLLGAVALAASDRSHPSWLGLLLGLSAATRPEGAGHAAVILLTLATFPSTRRRAAVASAIFGALLGALLLFRHHYYGDFLPNTYYAKATPGRALWLRGLRFVEEQLTFWAGIVGVVAVGYLAARGKSAADGLQRFRVLSATVCGAAYANTILVGGDTFLFHRFLLPAFPLTSIALACVTRRLVDPASPARRRSLAAAVALVASWSCGAGFLPRYSLLARGADPFYELSRGIQETNEHYFIVGRWLHDHLPPTTVMAVNAAGIVPYVSELRTIDMLGLNDAHIAHRPISLGSGLLGHEKYDPDYVLDRAPDVIIAGLPILSSKRLHVQDLGAWYGRFAPFIPGDRVLLQNPRLGAYTLKVAKVSDSRFLVLLVKRGSDADIRLRKA